MAIRKASNLVASTQLTGGGGGGAAAGGAESNLWAIPETPHAYDDEFDGATLSGWTGVQNITDAVPATISYGAVDSYDTTFTTGDVVRVNMEERNSWALIQVPSRTKPYAFYKSITLPTNLITVVRFKHLLPSTNANSNGEFCLSLWEDVGGVPTLDSRFALISNAAYSGSNRSLILCVNNVGTTYATIIGDSFADGLIYYPEYLAIHKVGSNYHFWIGAGQGAWTHLTTQTAQGFTPNMVGFHAHNTSTSGAGVPVVGVDFMRFYETANFFL